VPVVSVDHTEVAGPSEIVLSQSPPAGSPVDASTQASLVVSMPHQVQVPAIVGSTLEDAKPVLDSVSLLLDVAAKRESDQPEGSILEQDPAAGTPVERGSAVHVTIAVAPPQSATVPDLAGRSSEEAKALLAQVGLVIEVAGTRPTPGAQPDTVIEQNPRAGESVPAGTTVTVVLASADATVEVPEVRRLAVDAARTALGSVSLQLQVSGSTRSVDPEGTVLTQEPLPGSRVPAGSVVSVVVSAGGLVEVPRLIGMNQGAAVRQLELVNLVAEVTEDFEISRPPGTVIDQHPGAGEQVEPQTTVVLVVAIRRIGRPPVLPELVQPEVGPPRPDVLIRPEISLRPEPLAPAEPIPGSLRPPQ
jgi:serine/threonine-protein kinase